MGKEGKERKERKERKEGKEGRKRKRKRKKRGVPNKVYLPPTLTEVKFSFLKKLPRL